MRKHRIASTIAAKVGSENICEIIANNQARLLERPEIARGLTKNPNALKSTIDRVVDFLVRSSVILDGVAEFEQALLRLTGEERLAGRARLGDDINQMFQSFRSSHRSLFRDVSD